VEIAPTPVEIAPTPVETAPPEVETAPPRPVEAPAPPRWRDRLARARGSFGQALTDVFRKPALTAEDWEDVEALLLRADVGVGPTRRLIEDLQSESRKTTTPDQVVQSLRDELLSLLGEGDRTLRRNQDGLTVWMITGVNGTGKTTTIGKLAARLAAGGDRVVLAAADTFRAAADEQLELWARRAGAEVVKHAPGADPAAVAFDGVRAAKARGADVLIVDTAGRLHTKKNLMEELGKIRRVIEREAGEPHEVLLVLDATTGQNGIAQARAFTDAVQVSGIALTKLDGTARGGIVIACQQELGLPVKLVGLGEGTTDLAAFDPVAFVDALIG
jgi:fused signal recognition particle receptor